MVVIEGRFPGLNQYIHATNAGWKAGNAMKRKETERARDAALASGEPRHERRVNVHFHWVEPNARRDLDNIRFAAKFVLDGLVSAGILKDDSRRYVGRLSDTYDVDRDRPRVEVTLTDAGGHGMEDRTLPELGSELAVLTAVEKAVKERKADVRFEVDRQLRNLSEATGADSMVLRIADRKVGKVSLTEPKPAVGTAETFGRWAWESGKGHRRLVIDLDASGADDDEIMGAAEALMDATGASHASVEYEADADATKDLEIRKGRVVSKGTGEVVPGTYIKLGYTRVTGCKPQEVGKAMAVLGEPTTVAGLLEGESA